MPDRPLKVLVVDDNEALRENLAECLEGEGFEVAEAPNGDVALEQLAAAELAPDVVLMDLAMPGLDGRGLAQAIRAHPKLAGLRLVLITGHADAELSPELPVDVVLHKPFGMRELLAAMEKSAA
jgi:CheY-like chemotaxis protein